jgi:ribosome modulation factor
MTEPDDSSEDIDLSKEPEYEEGYAARNQGRTLEDCPYLSLSPRDRAWRAGWADADHGILSDLECGVGRDD